ncbi:hypothetical protein FHS78_000654 [Parvibaculum indicum]|uniref:hypothetical protein n=1 Tax=Parvibaculum indicum TaxID=562969 RepID=UPI0014223664|nr:hypothetical protein [Parvibaculum indicum]NIJ40384.1 hypothetical protein [Parvibaculum indicum]
MKTGFLNATEIPMPAGGEPDQGFVITDNAAFCEGDCVSHRQFGEGEVKAILPAPGRNDGRLEVDFIRAGIRRVSAINCEIIQ